MNLLHLFLFSVISFQCVCQSFDMYSDIWAYSKETKEITPKNGEKFSYPSSELLSKIDTSEIRNLLLKSFNEFRNDYNKPSVLEDSEMTILATIYAKNLSNNFCHDVNLPKDQSESISNINYALISKIDHTNQNVNKVIADCIFDIFICSDNHTLMLLNENDTKYGFGFYLNKYSFSVCIRSRQ